MKLQDLFESMDFLPSYFDKEKGYQTTPAQDVEVNCFNCEGTGKDPYADEICEYCHGTGKEKEFQYTVPNLNVANSNGYLILQMLGLYNKTDDNSVGIIKNAQLPEIRRKLIMLKNQDKRQQDFVRPPTGTRSPIKRTVSKGPDGTSRIETHGGSHFIDMGTSFEQIKRYIDKLLEIVETAQENGWDVSWH